MLKNSIEAEIGVGKVLSIKDKKVLEKLQTRNVLVHLSDLETLKVRTLCLLIHIKFKFYLF